VIGIERFRPILPDEHVDEAFVLKLLPKQAFVPLSHFADYTKRRAYFRRLSRGDARKKGKNACGRSVGWKAARKRGVYYGVGKLIVVAPAAAESAVAAPVPAHFRRLEAAARVRAHGQIAPARRGLA